MPSCAFPKCKNTTRTKNKSGGVTFHSFPIDVDRYRKWTETVRLARRDEEWTSNNYTRICSDHFTEDEMYTTGKGLRKLKKNAFPVTYKNTQTTNKRSVLTYVCDLCLDNTGTSTRAQFSIFVVVSTSR